MTNPKINLVLAVTTESIINILSEWRKLPEHGITAEQKNKMDEDLNAVLHSLKKAVEKSREDEVTGSTTPTGIPTLDLQGDKAKEEVKVDVLAKKDVEEIKTNATGEADKVETKTTEKVVEKVVDKAPVLTKKEQKEVKAKAEADNK